MTHPHRPLSFPLIKSSRSSLPPPTAASNPGLFLSPAVLWMHEQRPSAFSFLSCRANHQTFLFLLQPSNPRPILRPSHPVPHNSTAFLITPVSPSLPPCTLGPSAGEGTQTTAQLHNHETVRAPDRSIVIHTIRYYSSTTRQHHAESASVAEAILLPLTPRAQPTISHPLQYVAVARRHAAARPLCGRRYAN